MTRCDLEYYRVYGGRTIDGEWGRGASIAGADGFGGGVLAPGSGRRRLVADTAARYSVNRFKEDRPEALRQVRLQLVARLRARSTEIEDAVLSRALALAESTGDDDPDYSAGLRAAIAEVVDFALLGIEEGEDWPETIPSAAAAQARRAARNGVSLDTVLRRYAAGDRLLGEFIMSEADHFPAELLRKVIQSQGVQVDRLMAAVAAEYMDEVERMRRSPTQRLTERVQRVLAGAGPVGSEDFEYELEKTWHLGMILAGAKAKEAPGKMAALLSAQVLAVPRGSGIVWAWFGSRERSRIVELDDCLAEIPTDVSLAIGEPHRGVEGWRLTHREAQAAFEVMLRKPQRMTRSSDVLLLAAVLRDEVLAKALMETFLAPFDDRGDSGRVLRETLRAYFAAGLNAATAAAALGVDRHTVQRRLRKVEEMLGRVLHSCHAELEVALTLEELDPLDKPERMLAAG